MTIIKLLLNLPWSVLGLLAALVSIPRKITISRKPYAIVFYIRNFWWKQSKGVRGTVAGNVALMGPKLEKGDLKHELIHVEQFMREPLVHPLFYIYESLKYGYMNNKYEVEAYQHGGNPYIMPDGTKKFFK